jgi:lauroyl/myristoyl acyltransferase
MNLQRMLNSRGAGIWALRISKSLSPAAGLAFSRLVAAGIASQRQLPLVRAMRVNRWVVSACTLSAAQLDTAVRLMLGNMARSFYTLFHYINDPAGLQSQVVFSPWIEALIARSQEKKRGVVVAGVHLSNFDLVFQAASYHGLRGLALTLPDRSENSQAVEWQHAFRRQSGIELLPASLPNFRQAIRRLQDGECVLTGLDRPLSVAKYRPQFFGKPAHVPVHYIQLALAAKVPVMVFAAMQDAQGIYQIFGTDEITLQPNSDHRTELLCNAERVLDVAASYIRQAPEQWSITLPAWPDLLPEMP